MSDKSSRSEFSPQAEASIHLERAAFHLHEAGRVHRPDLPAYDDPLESTGRVDARYRIAGAHRRGIDTCRIVAAERVAASLAVLDGDRWPQCDRHVNANMIKAQREAVSAGKRQRYRHVAARIVAEIAAYYEMGTDTPEQRDSARLRIQAQLASDKEVSAHWRNRVMPSTVSQIRKDSSK